MMVSEPSASVSWLPGPAPTDLQRASPEVQRSLAVPRSSAGRLRKGGIAAGRRAGARVEALRRRTGAAAGRAKPRAPALKTLGGRQRTAKLGSKIHDGSQRAVRFESSFSAAAPTSKSGAVGLRNPARDANGSNVTQSRNLSAGQTPAAANPA